MMKRFKKLGQQVDTLSTAYADFLVLAANHLDKRRLLLRRIAGLHRMAQAVGRTTGELAALLPQSVLTPAQLIYVDAVLERAETLLTAIKKSIKEIEEISVV